VFVEVKEDGSGGDNWSYRLCKAPVYIITTNKPAPRADVLPVTQPTVSKALKGKISHSMDLLTPSSPGVFQLCL